jgi:Ran-binding protein 3
MSTVMRAEGSLRLILNACLYVGMPCLEDGKHVRTTVFEEGERRFITLRVGPSATSECC